jgi:phosphoribosylformimino-5-aminoimidazole carboxamide ribotide isomerase
VRAAEGSQSVILFPAIDIRDGKAVRLHRGRFEAETVYDQDPLVAAQRWVEEGARALHVVDLDGARTGAPVNLEHVRRIAQSADVPLQVGGGLRTRAAIQAAIDAGAERIVLGTAAYRDPAPLEELTETYGERVVVSLDARGGQIAAAGWLERTALVPEQLATELEARGVRHFVYSSIDRDGTLGGPDLEGAHRLTLAVNGGLVYSGGIASLADVEALARLRLEGVIVGKALYERRFTVREGQETLDRCTTSA